VPQLDDLKVLIADRKLDIVALCETWLDEDMSLREVALQGHRLFRRDRSRHGSGLAIYCSDHIVVRPHECAADIEFMQVVIESDEGLFFLVCTIARQVVTSVLLRLDLSHLKRVLMVCDFNVDLQLRVYSADAQGLLGFVAGLYVSLMVSEPTRTTRTTSTLIDHVISYFPQLVTTVSVEAPLGTSDHICDFFQSCFPLR